MFEKKVSFGFQLFESLKITLFQYRPHPLFVLNKRNANNVKLA